LRPAAAFAPPHEALSFWEVSARCRAVGELLLGVTSSGGGGEPTINPPDKASRRSWHPRDVFIVLAKER
jgi:hypothetical protein